MTTFSISSATRDLNEAAARRHGKGHTAEVYEPLLNEELVGEALAPFKGKVVIATKFGWEPNPEDGGKRSALNSRPEHIKQVAEACVTRLKVDAIDLFYQNSVDLNIAWISTFPSKRSREL